MGQVLVPKGFDPNVVRHWYLVANRVEALIYEGQLNGEFHYVKRLRNPKGKLMERELLSDRAGRSFSSARNGTRHGFEPRTPHYEEVALQFARRIASELDKAVHNQQFTDLVVLAEPHFLGLINKEMPKRVKAAIRREVPREWCQGSDRELEEYLRKKLA